MPETTIFVLSPDVGWRSEMAGKAVMVAGVLAEMDCLTTRQRHDVITGPFTGHTRLKATQTRCSSADTCSLVLLPDACLMAAVCVLVNQCFIHVCPGCIHANIHV